MHTPAYASILEHRRAELRTRLTEALARPQPLVLEVGCGHGHFLTAYAEAHPDRTCIGIDLVGERIERATRKRDRARLGNLFFIQTEARLFLETLPAEVRWAAIFVLFPDPWPKLRHNKHRLMQPSFLSALAKHANPDCPLFFRTDHTPYFEKAQAAVAGHPDWEIRDEPWPFEFETVFQQRADAFHSLVARRRNNVGAIPIG